MSDQIKPTIQKYNHLINMKKITLIILCATMFACNKTNNNQSINKALLITPDAETIFTYDSQLDTATGKTKLNIEDWIGRLTMYDKIKSGIVSGKMKAYKNYPKGELRPDEF